MLRLKGHRAEMATDARAGLQRVDEEDYDAVFTDLSMPDLNGWQILDRVRSGHPDLPVILVTGWGRELDAEETRARGALTVLSKPFRVRDIESALAQIPQPR
jgi:CheY-like chemotaxis protein